MRDRERDLLRQVDKKQQECDLKHNENERLNQKLRTVQSYTSTLEKDLKESRDQVTALTNQINNGQNESVKNVHAKNKAEVTIIDLKGSLQSLKDENFRLMNDLGQANKDLQTEKQKVANQSTQIERLRSLVENLDSTKDELLAKLQSALSEKRGGDGEKAVLFNDI